MVDKPDNRNDCTLRYPMHMSNEITLQDHNWSSGQRCLNAPAMLLAAGRGERMRPLTDSVPKPLLKVRGKPLMLWHAEALAKAGCPKVVVNTAWLGQQIEQTMGNALVLKQNEPQSGKAASMPIAYSHEAIDFGRALETAGGIARALPLLADEVFWVVAGDVFMPGFTFDSKSVTQFKQSGMLAHIWLVPNPEHNLKGDFGLDLNALPPLAQNLTEDTTLPRYTYSTIGLYRKELFGVPWCDIEPGNPKGVSALLAPLLRAAMRDGCVSAELYDGEWTDVGTPERLAKLNVDNSEMN